ncbi:hypothetical protein KUL113_03580 [Tenacibaculum sp. KUL113]|nr:hypothetical protein KUL113_03580 [Tenacibaculum sp. KUL113]
MIKELNSFCDHHYEQGIQDCYSLVRDFYKTRYQIEITNYARPDNWIQDPSLDFFTSKFEKEGFKDTNNNPHKVRFGDVLMMRIAGSQVVNHVAIYVGRQKILHHLQGRLSEIVDYTDKWRIRVVRVVRHPEVEKTTEAMTLHNLHKGLPIHLRAKLRGAKNGTVE